MAVITFMSDFGTEDHYVAAVKAAILRHNPSISITDISHQINLGDIGQAAYLLSNVFRDFPKGTVHLCAIDQPNKQASRLCAVKLEEHLFVGPDSGLFSLISNQRPTAIVDINAVKPKSSTFTAKDILAPAAAALASGKNIHEMGPSMDAVHKLMGRQLKATKKEISGNVIRVDNYGNLITNILKSEFETIRRVNGHVPFAITIGREVVSEVHEKYEDVESGECFVIFNSNDLMEIGINKGSAQELLGIKHDTAITINFMI